MESGWSMLLEERWRRCCRRCRLVSSVRPRTGCGGCKAQRRCGLCAVWRGMRGGVLVRRLGCYGETAAGSIQAQHAPGLSFAGYDPCSGTVTA
jgi:hypothetical protein